MVLTRSAFRRQGPEVQIFSPRPTCSVSLPAPLARPGQTILGPSVRRREHSPDARDTWASPRAASPTHTALCWYTALWPGPRHAPYGSPGACTRLRPETDADARAGASRIRAGTREMTHCIRLADIVYLQVDSDEIQSKARNTSPKHYNEPCRPRSRVLRCRNDRGEPRLRGYFDTETTFALLPSVKSYAT